MLLELIISSRGLDVMPGQPEILAARVRAPESGAEVLLLLGCVVLVFILSAVGKAMRKSGRVGKRVVVYGSFLATVAWFAGAHAIARMQLDGDPFDFSQVFYLYLFALVFSFFTVLKLKEIADDTGSISQQQNSTQTITVLASELASHLGRTEKEVLIAIQQGEIKGFKSDGVWYAEVEVSGDTS